MSKNQSATAAFENKPHVSPMTIGSADSSPSTSFSGLYNSRAVPSETSSDDSEESSREKFEGLQALVRQLNRQLQSEKIRKEGITTISQSLKEERNENKSLREENQKYKQALKVLQNRLANARLQTNIELGDDESTSSILGFEALDGLVRENLVLKDELKYLSIDPSKMDETVKQNNELKERSLHLQHQLLQATEENHALKKLLASSSDEKLLENSKLLGQLEELQQRGQTKDVLCQSLSEQSHALQERLRETSTMCQQLLQRLEKHEPVGNIESRGSNSALFHHESPLSSTFVKLSLANPDLEHLQKEYTVLQDKMSGLRTQLKEVIKVNEKWQEYHEKRDSEFKELKGRLHMMEQQLAQTAPSSHISEHQQEQIDNLILQYKRKIEVIENEKEMLGDENRKLRVHLSEQTATNHQLEQQIKALLEQLRCRQQHGGSSKDDKERIQALEMQVKLFSEDFASEKHDRQREQARVADLEREISAYKSQLEALQRGAMSRIQHRHTGHRPAGHGMIQCDDDEDFDLDDVPMPVPSGPPMQLIGRGPNQSESEGEDQVDNRLPTSKQRSKDTDQTIPMVARPATNSLQCPQCQKEFPTDLHYELLEHMETCLQ